MRHLKDLPVLILGLGASGLAMARWCARHGAVVTVADTREAPASLATLQAELPDVTFIGGPFTAALVEGTPIRAVYRSPGLSPAMLAPVVDAAKAVGLVVGGELDLFARALLDLRTVEVPVVEAEAEAPVETVVPEPVVEAPAQAELALSEAPAAIVAPEVAAPETAAVVDVEAETTAPAETIEATDAVVPTDVVASELTADVSEPAEAAAPVEPTEAVEPTPPAMAEAMPRDASLSVLVTPPTEDVVAEDPATEEGAAPAATADAPDAPPAPASAASLSRLPPPGKPYVPTAALEAAAFVATIAELSATNPASAAVEEEATPQMVLVPEPEPEAPKGYTPAVLAVTGTNGKTTVTALTGQLVERAGKTVAVAGNIGPTLLDTLPRTSTPARCPRCGCSNSRASSSTACRASSPRLRPCSTSRRTTSTGMATCRPTRPRRRASSAPRA